MPRMTAISPCDAPRNTRLGAILICRFASLAAPKMPCPRPALRAPKRDTGLRRLTLKSKTRTHRQ